MAIKTKSLLFTEQFYYPEGWGGAQIPRDITTSLALHGWQVEVLCGNDLYAPVLGTEHADPRSVGVRICRVPQLIGGDIQEYKLLKQLCYYAVAFPRLLFSSASLFATQTNPPLIVPIVALASSIRRKPMVVIAQDLYPEVLFAHTKLAEKTIAARLLRWIFKIGYQRASKVISLGPHMSSRLHAKGVPANRIIEISNWATGDENIVRGVDNKLRDAWGLSGKFVLLYSGNLGIAHDVETPIKAVAETLRHIPNLILLFVGKGSRMNEARALAAALKIENAVHFRPFVPFELLAHSLGLADVALVTLRQGFEGLVVPSKLLGQMARAVPTLYVGPNSDVEFFLRESGGGVCISNGDVQGLSQSLVRLAASRSILDTMADAAQRYYEKHLAKNLGIDRYLAAFDDFLTYEQKLGR